MIEILRDPIWQFIGACVAFVTVVVSIALYELQQRRKDLTYTTISITPVLRIAEEVKGKLAIRFGDKSVQDLHRIVVKIKNSGNVPIRHTDYDSPVRFNFGVKAQILAIEVANANPASLQRSARAIIDGTDVVLTPVLLNPKWSITLDLLVNQYEGLKAEGLIAGIDNRRYRSLI